MLLKIFSMTLMAVILASCTTEPTIIVDTKIIRKDIQIQPRPRPVIINDVNWRVVNQDNFEDFRIEMGPNRVFFVLSDNDFKNLTLNLNDIRRFIKQQKELIVYYEESVRNEKETVEESL